MNRILRHRIVPGMLSSAEDSCQECHSAVVKGAFRRMRSSVRQQGAFGGVFEGLPGDVATWPNPVPGNEDRFGLRESVIRANLRRLCLLGTTVAGFS